MGGEEGCGALLVVVGWCCRCCVAVVGFSSPLGSVTAGSSPRISITLHFSRRYHTYILTCFGSPIPIPEFLCAARPPHSYGNYQTRAKSVVLIRDSTRRCVEVNELGYCAFSFPYLWRGFLPLRCSVSGPHFPFSQTYISPSVPEIPPLKDDITSPLHTAAPNTHTR